MASRFDEETAAIFQKSRIALEKAQAMLEVGWPDEAGRSAYMAAFHAAQAFLLPKLGRAAKTHRGVSAEFSRLSKDDPRLDIELRKFLGRGYNVKEQADYGLQAPTTTQAQAGEMLATARRFVDVVEHMVSQI